MHSLFINNPHSSFVTKGNNILSPITLQRNIREADSSAIFRDSNARTLTQNAVDHFAHSASMRVYAG